MKKILDVLCFVVGAFLIIYFLPVIIGSLSPHGYSFPIFDEYTDTDMLSQYIGVSRIGLAIGVSLVCLGFLIRSWEKEGEK
ncbi:MAG TPA: hypothetical protein P5150_07845 [Candidatus Ratteibacteria bacterium]|nr:hypothetical protein [Candidatus Ratteibacteria bacterium]